MGDGLQCRPTHLVATSRPTVQPTPIPTFPLRGKETSAATLLFSSPFTAALLFSSPFKGEAGWGMG